MGSDRPRARAALAVALSCGVTFLLLRIALSPFWEAGAWHAAPPANVVALGAMGAVGIVCGLLLLARPGALPRMACIAWAAIVAILAVALAARGHGSAVVIAALAAGVGAVALPWGTGQPGRPGPARQR